MDKALTSRRWFTAWRSVERPAQDDPADLGTAFGLDLSLSELPHEPQPAARRPGWVRRLADRRKSGS